jgi:hypothetical protein
MKWLSAIRCDEMIASNKHVCESIARNETAYDDCR